MWLLICSMPASIFSLMSADRLDCAEGCPFGLECGTQVYKNDRQEIAKIKAATGASRVTYDFPKRVELADSEGHSIGSIQAGYIHLRQNG